MPHDPTKFLMGATGSSDRNVSDYAADPASFPAGVAVRQKNDGGLSLSSSDGALVGVSLGKSMSDHKKTSVVRDGNRVPLALTNEGTKSSLTVGDLTFEALTEGTDGDSITITLADTETAGAETVSVDGTDITIGMEDGVSTAQQIADAVEASEAASALVTVTIAGGEESTAQDAATEDNLAGGAEPYPFAVLGAAVRVSNSTGKAISSSGTLTGATYISGKLTGVAEDGSEIAVALIDMGGGL